MSAAAITQTLILDDVPDVLEVIARAIACFFVRSEQIQRLALVSKLRRTVVTRDYGIWCSRFGIAGRNCWPCGSARTATSTLAAICNVFVEGLNRHACSRYQNAVGFLEWNVLCESSARHEQDRSG